MRVPPEIDQADFLPHVVDEVHSGGCVPNEFLALRMLAGGFPDYVEERYLRFGIRPARVVGSPAPRLLDDCLDRADEFVPVPFKVIDDRFKSLAQLAVEDRILI